MRTIVYFACLIPLLLGVSPTAAGAPAAEAPPLTVDEAVAAALRSNPLRQAALRTTDAARAGVGAARALSNPSVVVTPSIAGPAGADEELSVAQPLELNGARGARTRVARAQLRVARSEAVVTTRDLVREVKLAYYDLARAREVLDLQRESVTIAEEFERIARRQVELGARPGIDLTQLQVELTRARQLQIQAESGAHIAEANLNTLMGRSPDTSVPGVSRLSFAAHGAEAGEPRFGAEGGGGALWRERQRATAPGAVPRGGEGRAPGASAETALNQRAEVAAEQARLEALRQETRLIRTEGRPDLAIGGRLESLTNRPRIGGVGLGITLPFIDYGSRRNRLRQTRRLAEAQTAQVQATRNQVRLDVEAALTRLRAAEQLVRRYQEGLIDQARRLADAERTRFQTGAGSPLTVLEAQRTYRAVLSDYYGALAAHEQARAELEWALGSVNPPGESPDSDRPDAIRRSPR